MDGISGRSQGKYSGIRQDAISGCSRIDLGLNRGLFLTICLRFIYEIPALCRQRRKNENQQAKRGVFSVSLEGIFSARGRSVSWQDTVESVLGNIPTIHLRQQRVTALPARKGYAAPRNLKAFAVDLGEAAWGLRRAI